MDIIEDTDDPDQTKSEHVEAAAITDDAKEEQRVLGQKKQK